MKFLKKGNYGLHCRIIHCLFLLWHYLSVLYYCEVTHMSPKHYVENALRTESQDLAPVAQRIGSTDNIRLIHAGMGMATEAAEFVDMMKKHIFYGKPVDHINLVEELGDLMWYIAIASDVLNVSLERIMEVNINKLRARYPTKFREDLAINRNLDKEREILER